MIKLPAHLGGHANITHIDEKVLEYVLTKFSIKKFLDIGCGPGGMVELAVKKGLYAVGIDGDFTLKNNNIIIHDFTKGKIILDQTFDLGWSVEFLEHVSEKYIENYIEAFNKCEYIIITHALPGKGGHHHVNCRVPEYWINLFKQNNYNLLVDETKIIREISSMKREFMKNTGLFFKKL